MLKENNSEETYLTPTEILEKYPILNLRYNWGTLDLGTMLKCKILDGHYDRSKRVGVIKDKINRVHKWFSRRAKSKNLNIPL